MLLSLKSVVMSLLIMDLVAPLSGHSLRTSRVQALLPDTLAMMGGVSAPFLLPETFSDTARSSLSGLLLPSLHKADWFLFHAAITDFKGYTAYKKTKIKQP